MPQPYSQYISILVIDSLILLSGGGGLLGLVATELLLGLGLDGLVGLLEGGGTLNGSGAEVSTVTVLGSLVGNSLVGPVRKNHGQPRSTNAPCRITTTVWAVDYSLAVALGSAVRGLDEVLGGLVGLSLLGGDNNSTLLARGDTEGLLIRFV
jgi:hypothetical protein